MLCASGSCGRSASALRMTGSACVSFCCASRTAARSTRIRELPESSSAARRMLVCACSSAPMRCWQRPRFCHSAAALGRSASACSYAPTASAKRCWRESKSARLALASTRPGCCWIALRKNISASLVAPRACSASARLFERTALLAPAASADRYESTAKACSPRRRWKSPMRKCASALAGASATASFHAASAASGSAFSRPSPRITQLSAFVASIATARRALAAASASAPLARRRASEPPVEFRFRRIDIPGFRDGRSDGADRGLKWRRRRFARLGLAVAFLVPTAAATRTWIVSANRVRWHACSPFTET